MERYWVIRGWWDRRCPRTRLTPVDVAYLASCRWGVLVGGW